VDSLWSYTVAGYLITAGAVGLYTASLFLRGRRARSRAEAIAAARRNAPSSP
jgi:hypothetical protein